MVEAMVTVATCCIRLHLEHNIRGQLPAKTHRARLARHLAAKQLNDGRNKFYSSLAFLLCITNNSHNLRKLQCVALRKGKQASTQAGTQASKQANKQAKLNI